MNHDSPFEVSAADMNRRFREVRDRAQSGTVTITHHGKPSLILLSVTRYRALLANGGADVTRRKFTMMLDNLAEGFLALDTNGVIETVNRSAETFIGSTRDELIGQSFATVFADAEDTIQQARQSIETGEISTRERFSVRFPNRRVSITTFPLPEPEGGVAILFANLTELDRTRAALAASEATTAALLDQLDDAIVVVTDRDDIILRWGRGAQALLGWSDRDVIGRRLVTLVAPGEEIDGADAVRFVTKDGDLLAAVGRSAPVDGADGSRMRLFRPTGD